MNSINPSLCEQLLLHTLDFCNECVSQRNLAGALEALGRAHNLAPRDSSILNQRGRVLLALQEFEAAKLDFSKAISIEADSAPAHSGLARFHLALGHWDDAEKFARRALAVDPADDDANAALMLLARQPRGGRVKAGQVGGCTQEDSLCITEISRFQLSPPQIQEPTAPTKPTAKPIAADFVVRPGTETNDTSHTKAKQTAEFKNADELAICKLAEYVGKDWKQQPYYADAEQYMEKQWRETIWPFIKEADFSCVLDLAAGHGRNSEKLKDHAKGIYLVDINQENIDFCQQRFAGDSRFQFLRNDGCSLGAIPSGAVTLVYCFDAMVHFDSDVVRAYLREFQRVMRPGGLGFCHHSNYMKNPGGDVHANPGWRNFMSQQQFAHYCVKEGLTVVKSRLIDWSCLESDCVTLFKKP